MREQRVERRPVAVLIAPIEHLALEPERREGAELEVRDDGRGRSVGGDHDDERSLVLVEVVGVEAREVRTGHERDRVEPGGPGDLSKGLVAVRHRRGEGGVETRDSSVLHTRTDPIGELAGRQVEWLY